MQSPSINTVMEQFEFYRQSRSYRKQPVSDEIISNLKALVKGDQNIVLAGPQGLGKAMIVPNLAQQAAMRLWFSTLI